MRYLQEACSGLKIENACLPACMLVCLFVSPPENMYHAIIESIPQSIPIIKRIEPTGQYLEVQLYIARQASPSNLCDLAQRDACFQVIISCPVIVLLIQNMLNLVNCYMFDEKSLCFFLWVN